jgi:peptidyl-prolyl cis-trans isomerase B (cyclophilin B)
MLDSPFLRRSRLGAGLALALALAACGSSSSSSVPTTGIAVGNESVPAADASQLSSSATDSATATTTTSAAAQYPAGCTAATAPTPEAQPHLTAPTAKLDATRRYTVKLDTNCGAIDIALAVHQAPKIAASFAYLVKRGFFNHLTFHRIVAGFVIQGGDPLGTGLGGPGYSVVEAPPANVKYAIGSVAMAKTGAEANGTAGSQFFIVTGAQGTTLPAQYALLGHVTGGLAAVMRIASVPVSSTATGTPAVPVVISSATLAVS